MKIKFILGCLPAFLLASCSTISHTGSTTGVETEVYNRTVADLKVSEQKASATVNWSWRPFSSVSVEAEKENATATLLNEAKADVVVEPQYIVKRRGLFRGGSVTVTGYPATYKNFRNMTPEDAEAIATLDGKVSYVNPVIATSTSYKVRKRKKKETTDLDFTSKSKHKFFNLIGGFVIDSKGDADLGGQLGLMYGSYGRRWGWYVKGLWMCASANERYSYEGEETTRHLNGGQLTFGVIKTINPEWNVFLGAGGAASFYLEDEPYGKYFDVCPALPVEIGGQWRTGGINLMAGLSAVVNFEDNANSRVNLNPFVGIGFSF